MRHAETAAPDRFHGAESDIDLGARGREQAAELAHRLAGLRPGALFSSPMRRALETAAPIAEACSLPLEIIAELHERGMGTLSGTLKTDGWSWYAEEKSRWMAGEVGYTREGGESFAQVRARALHALHKAIADAAGQTIVVITHGVLIKIALVSLLDELRLEDFDRIGIDTTAVNDLRWDGARWRAEALNSKAEFLR
jgi:2,3-bisphosphoglycerate-dependent phosphoglycerate mutase